MKNCLPLSLLLNVEVDRRMLKKKMDRKKLKENKGWWSMKNYFLHSSLNVILTLGTGINRRRKLYGVEKRGEKGRHVLGSRKMYWWKVRVTYITEQNLIPRMKFKIESREYYFHPRRANM